VSLRHGPAGCDDHLRLHWCADPHDGCEISGFAGSGTVCLLLGQSSVSLVLRFVRTRVNRWPVAWLARPWLRIQELFHPGLLRSRPRFTPAGSVSGNGRQPVAVPGRPGGSAGTNCPTLLRPPVIELGLLGVDEGIEVHVLDLGIDGLLLPWRAQLRLSRRPHHRRHARRPGREEPSRVRS
jgi:hypothetical protein